MSASQAAAARPLAPGRRLKAAWAAWAGCAAVALSMLAGCGGGDSPSSPAACSVADQQIWLRDHMDEWYFWADLSPRPDRRAFSDLAGYFDAILYTGTDPAFPADRWSRYESSEAFNRLFGDGAALGYGISVAGLELGGQVDQPLRVRHIEALSPAAAAGVLRGDEVLSLNGRATADLLAADDLSALTAGAAGQTLTLRLARDGVQRTVTVTAAVFTLTPVSGAAVLTSPLGRPLGYVVVKDMIGQAVTPLETAFAGFKAAGVADVVIDLRYNGGGLVSTGATLASYVAGAAGVGLNYATLLYGAKQAAARNQSFRFANPASALGLPRAIVLTGRRTCSASEQVINGLRGAGVQVVTIGEATCGKPVGFVPAEACGLTFSVVTFESVNHRNEGRYFDGFVPTCAVAEDFSVAQGSRADPLVAAALHVADAGACPTRLQPLTARPRAAGAAPEPGERPAMIPR